MIWMYCQWKSNNLINKIHERTLLIRIAYDDYVSDFGFLLEKDDSVTIHQRNIQVLTLEIYKTQKNLNPTFMNDDDINPRGISKHGYVKVNFFSGATSEAMKDYINPTIRLKPDAVLIHVGTNDINLNTDTLKNLQTIVARVKRKSAHMKIIISSLIIRQDQRNIEGKIKEMNKDIKAFCEENLVEFLSNENIDSRCLGKGKLHPNKKGEGLPC